MPDSKRPKRSRASETSARSSPMAARRRKRRVNRPWMRPYLIGPIPRRPIAASTGGYFRAKILLNGVRRSWIRKELARAPRLDRQRNGGSRRQAGEPSLPPVAAVPKSVQPQRGTTISRSRFACNSSTSREKSMGSIVAYMVPERTGESPAVPVSGSSAALAWRRFAGEMGTLQKARAAPRCRPPR